MTITLHWWVIPLALVLFGLFLVRRSDDEGVFPNPGLWTLGFACVIAAIFFTFGWCLR